MVQNQHELLHMIAAGTINARDGVHLLQSLKMQPKLAVAAKQLNNQHKLTQTKSPRHNLSGRHLPWLHIQVPIKN